ncbi:divalent metal cation transporter, partial [Metallosphaera sp.]
VYFSSSRNYLFYLAINVGAVVTPPCMLIYQSSATATKYSSLRIDTSKKVSWLNLETVLGSIVTEIVVVIAEIVGTVLGGVDPEDPLKLGNVLGQLRFIFGVTLITAGFLTLVVVSLSSAWGVLEATNRNSYSNTIKLYVLESIPAILVILIMGSNYSTIVNFALTLLSLSPIVVALPGILIGILVSKREIMGGYAYGKARLILYFVTIALITLGGIIGIIELA